MWCGLCGASEVEWVHYLDPAKTTFRKYGKGHIWADQIQVCERCDQLFRQGDFEALVLLQASADQIEPDDIDELIRKPFAVYCAAYLRSVAYHDVLPAGTRSLRDEGFVPLGELTGDEDVAAAWPAEHRRSLMDADEEQFWLIRSPWPNVSMVDAFSVIWDFVEVRAPVVGHRVDLDQHRAAIAEFTALNEGQLRSLIAIRDARDS